MRRVIPVAMVGLALLVGAGPSWAKNSGKNEAEQDAKKARQKVEKGVKGNLWAAATGEFELALNGKKIVQNDTKLPKEIELKPGDRLTARIVDSGTGRGFALIFLSANEKVLVSSNTGEWFSYRPPNDIQWSIIPADVLARPTKATRAADQGFKGEIEGAAAQGCEGVWSDPGSDKAYLFKTVIADDLME